MIRLLFLTFTLFLPALLFSQTYWKITSERGEQLLLTIVINEKKNEFEAFTRRNALKDIAGTFNYFLALTAGKIQYPEVIFIEGKTSREADSLVLTGTFYYIEKRFPFRAAIYGNHISGRFIDYKNKFNRMDGIRVPTSKPLNDYPAVFNSGISVTERYLANPRWLKSEEWLDFRSRLNELKSLISDDYEIGAAWFWLSRSLPFSPYELNRENPYKKPVAAVRKITIREPRTRTALLEAGMLPVTAREMDTLSLLIAKRGYTNLIIDLRGKSGIQPESVEYLLSYLSQVPFTGGIYPTRKFTDHYKTLPKSNEYQKYFRSFTEVPYKTGEFRNETGRYFKITPYSKTFKGKVYLLSDSKTSGVSSSFIYLAKKHKLATIAGQHASVSSGIGERIPLNSDYSLTMIISEFTTAENRYLTTTDLQPDIILHEEDALEYVLNIIR